MCLCTHVGRPEVSLQCSQVSLPWDLKQNLSQAWNSPTAWPVSPRLTCFHLLLPLQGCDDPPTLYTQLLKLGSGTWTLVLMPFTPWTVSSAQLVLHNFLLPLEHSQSRTNGSRLFLCFHVYQSTMGLSCWFILSSIEIINDCQNWNIAAVFPAGNHSRLQKCICNCRARSFQHYKIGFNLLWVELFPIYLYSEFRIHSGSKWQMNVSSNMFSFQLQQWQHSACLLQVIIARRDPNCVVITSPRQGWTSPLCRSFLVWAHMCWPTNRFVSLIKTLTGTLLK